VYDRGIDCDRVCDPCCGREGHLQARTEGEAAQAVQRIRWGRVEALLQVASWLNDRRQPPKESLYFIQYVYQGCKIADEFVLTVGSFVVAAAYKDQV
jgi:hypothetical protein